MSETMPTHPSLPDSDGTSSGKSRLVVRTMVTVLIVIVVVAGGTIWWMSHKSHPAKDQAEAFIRDLVAQDLPSAKARCTSDVDFDELERLMGKMRFWGKMDDPSLVINVRGDRADVDGSLTFDKLSKAFSATLMKQPDGTYRITAYGFN
jgi:hypothetical protein